MSAFEGIRVLDTTLLQQGSSATTYLADMGAEVIKIEDLVRADRGRGKRRVRLAKQALLQAAFYFGL